MLVVGIIFLVVVAGQRAGTLTPEVHPSLSTQTCSLASPCTTVQSYVTLDSNWRWLHSVDGFSNCYSGNMWNPQLCNTSIECTSNCALEGVDMQTYTETYGISTSGSHLNLKLVTQGPYSENVGSRVYLMKDKNNYELFKLKNREFTFDVDVSQLPCGLNGALYFSEMLADGGKSSFPSNLAGAKYGTGYCDAQCPHDIKFINGEANSNNWTPSSATSGYGRYGTCCSELDIWEANAMSTSFTAHPCSLDGPTRCAGINCGDGEQRFEGLCDKNGCDFNPFRMGNQSFYGSGIGHTINSDNVFTVVTQFITNDSEDSGDLIEIKRFYVQDGVLIYNPVSTYDTLNSASSIANSYCKSQKALFHERDVFTEKGGLKAMGDSMERGMVLVMSLWDDNTAYCLWLDSVYPVDADPSIPGASRGLCSTTSGHPYDVEAAFPDSVVTFSNIKTGSIGSTFPTLLGTVIPATPTINNPTPATPN